MKVLVTGGAGFIGSHVVESCLADEQDVVVVDDLSSGRQEQLPTGVKFYQVDIRDPALDDVFAREHPRVVSHQAARANVRESMEKPLLYADVNVLGSLNLLECSRRHGVQRVVYASTGGAVYGEPQSLPVREDHPINPLDPYGASKHHVEHYLYLYRENFGIRYTILRYPNVYGPRQDPYGEAGVVAIFARHMLERGSPVINGSGEQERDFVYVGDVARANVLALQQAESGIFNIGSGLGTSVNRIFGLLATLTAYDRPSVHGAAKQGEVFKVYLDATRAREELGWAPRVGLEDGLHKTVEYFRSQLEDS